MEPKSILVQLDTDPQPSVFDRVVAVDAGIDHIFSYGGVTPENVEPLVHGCIFTRGPKDLKRTAIFIGGSDMAAGEELYRTVLEKLSPFTVSVMLDSNGSNTTAAAAVREASKHLDLRSTKSLVLGGTGPVGQRVARLLARHGGDVRIGSRQKERAEQVAQTIRRDFPSARVEAISTSSSLDGPNALDGRTLVVAAGAAGAVLLPRKIRDTCKTLQMLIDLNGVPPAGIEGVELMDKAVEREGIRCYGAIGVGGTKMKLHKLALKKLFERSDLTLSTDAISELADNL